MLMTDVLQFVILMVSVVFVVPLILMKAGGWRAFMAKVPEGFTSPVAHDFTWWFLVGWVLIHFFKIGGEWAFVQRYTCVPTVKDARKAAYIFGVMYLISPLFWMLPPLVFRVINPHADFEQAYVLACKLVLPAGMMGLMVAAMASATASMATTQLNVFAGAFTTEFYKRLINRGANDRQLVFAGRVFTVILGLTVMGGALLIPRYGYTRYIIDITTLMTGPLILPTIWGLFSRKLGLGAVWVTTSIGFVAAFIVKFGFCEGGLLVGVEWLYPLTEWVGAHARIADLTVGVVTPFIVLCALELFAKEQHPGWERVVKVSREFQELPPVKSSTLPAVMVAVTLTLIAVMMSVLAFVNKAEFRILITFAAVLYLIASGIGVAVRAKRLNPRWRGVEATPPM